MNGNPYSGNIKKYIYSIVLMATLMLILTGCGEAEQEQMRVYSFSGENEQLAVSNGVIVLHGKEETFFGGNLKAADHIFTDITSFTVTFYRMSGSEKDIILSNSVDDMSGGTVNVPNDLGKVSGESIFHRIKKDGTSDMENSFHFELITVDNTGKESVYQLQLLLTEVTKNTDNEIQTTSCL